MRVYGVVPAFALVLVQLPALGVAGSISIDHPGVDCVEAGKFARFVARFDPAAEVARARLHFKPERWPHWYSVPIQREGWTFWGVLPKPDRTLNSFTYYISVVNQAFEESRTAEYTPAVVSGPGACQGKKVLALVVQKASRVIVNGPSEIANAPLVPPGFAADGVIAGTEGVGASSVAGAATGGAGGTGAVAGGAATLGAAAAGGGLGTTALVLGGVAVAGGTVAVVATKGGGGGAKEPPSLTGHWVGSSVFNYPPPTACTQTADTSVDLVQSGSSLTGTRHTIPTTTTCTGDSVDPPFDSPTGGTTSGNNVTLVESGHPSQSVSFQTTFAGTLAADHNRMSGTLSGTVNTKGAAINATGTWELSRR